MRRRERKERKTPGIMLSPMIDMIFLLLVFFIVSTLNMAEIKTIPIRLPVAENSIITSRNPFTVTIKKDGSLFLEDQPIGKKTLISKAAAMQKSDENFSILIRGEDDVNYKLVIKLMDEFKGAGVTRFGLATDIAGDGK